MNNIYFLVLLISVGVESAPDDCPCKQLYYKLCLVPPKQSMTDITFQSMIDSQPLGGYRGELGNEMGRIHMAEVLLGKKLSLSNNLSTMCFKKFFERQYPNNKGGESTIVGFGILESAQEKCIPSKRVKGMLTCRVKTREPSKYVEILDLYFSHADIKRNLFVVVMCFDDGHVGWHSLASKAPLTEQDKRVIQKHVQQLGFPLNSTVEMYTGKCE